MATVLPTPTLAGQSPGRGDTNPPAGGGPGGGGGLPPVGPDWADEEPHAASELLIPMAAIVRNIAELPTAFPIEVRNSRRAMRFFSPVIIIKFPGLAEFVSDVYRCENPN